MFVQANPAIILTNHFVNLIRFVSFLRLLYIAATLNYRLISYFYYHKRSLISSISFNMIRTLTKAINHE